MNDIDERTYSSAEVCRMLDVTYRKLDYWTRLGLIRPSFAEAAGSGSKRRWTTHDLAVVRRVKLASDLAGLRLVDALDRLDDLEHELRGIPA